MEEKAKQIVLNYIKTNFAKPNAISAQLFVVWSCYILGNRKYLIGFTETDHYFEVTFNKILDEWYLDVYSKKYNKVIPNGSN